MNFKLPTQIMLAMLFGVVVGVLFKEQTFIFSAFLEPIGNVFIRLLKMIIVPIIFSSLVVGVVSLGSVQSLGRLGTRTFIYYMVTTFMAVMIGLIVVNFIKPGIDSSIDLSLFSSNPIFEGVSHDVSFVSVITDIVPSNVISAIATENMLGIIFFSILFGTGLLALDVRGSSVKQFVEEFNLLFLKITDWIMKLSPIGVFALIATMVGQTGFAIFKPMAFYVATVLLAIIIHLLFTLSSILIIVARYSPITFFQKIFPAIATAFATDSSIASLPVTMECLEKNVGVSKKVVGFIAPLGATVNMDGTALYEAVAAVFIAQVVGIDMTITQQIIVMLMAILASVGAAGIPSAGLVTLVIVLKAVNLPLEGIGILLAVDRILDMFRTSVNIISDSCGALVIGRLEGEQFFDSEV